MSYREVPRVGEWKLPGEEASSIITLWRDLDTACDRLTSVSMTSAGFRINQLSQVVVGVYRKLALPRRKRSFHLTLALC
ncbi:hypothetical protein J6590_060442 [Homalodisca vitripennis]|nr:hypothetical protein J6590_060442 [Homalodisca vitripennis]